MLRFMVHKTPDFLYSKTFRVDFPDLMEGENCFDWFPRRKQLDFRSVGCTNPATHCLSFQTLSRDGSSENWMARCSVCTQLASPSQPAVNVNIFYDLFDANCPFCAEISELSCNFMFMQWYFMIFLLHLAHFVQTFRSSVAIFCL